MNLIFYFEEKKVAFYLKKRDENCFFFYSSLSLSSILVSAWIKLFLKKTDKKKIHLTRQSDDQEYF